MTDISQSYWMIVTLVRFLCFLSPPIAQNANSFTSDHQTFNIVVQHTNSFTSDHQTLTIVAQHTNSFTSDHQTFSTQCQPFLQMCSLFYIICWLQIELNCIEVLKKQVVDYFFTSDHQTLHVCKKMPTTFTANLLFATFAQWVYFSITVR